METLIKRSDLLLIPFTRMRVDPDNERKDLGDMTTLIASIREEGVKEPMWGYKKKEADGEWYYACNGSRRYAALKIIYSDGAGPDISAKFMTFDPRLINPEQRIVERILRNEGLPFSMIEKAEAIGKLKNYGWDDKKIAEKLGTSITLVINALKLFAAPEAIKKLVVRKEVSASTAIELVKTEKTEEFLVDYKAGKYEPETKKFTNPSIPYFTPEAIPGEPSKEKKMSQARITKRDIEKYNQNSWQNLKFFLKSCARDEPNISEDKISFFYFCEKVRDNKLTEKQIQDYFKKTDE